MLAQYSEELAEKQTPFALLQLSFFAYAFRSRTVIINVILQFEMDNLTIFFV
jgi:hypothetical protein